MSVIERLSVSGLFNDGRWQQSSNHKVFFQVRGWRGATIFVAHDESEFLIREGALQNNRFPNNEKLYDFVRSNAHGTVRGKGHPTNDFRLSSEHIEEVIEFIRSVLYPVLEKFKEAFPGQHKETKSNDTISLGKGATVYFRNTRAGPNQARIHSKRVRNFPNALKLQSYLEQNNVPKDTRPDYKIGPEHADQVIAILKEGG